MDKISNSSSVVVSDAYYATAGRVFQSRVTFASFVLAVNNGEYIFNATVVPSSSYIIGNSAIGRYQVSFL